MQPQCQNRTCQKVRTTSWLCACDTPNVKWEAFCKRCRKPRAVEVAAPAGAEPPAIESLSQRATAALSPNAVEVRDKMERKATAEQLAVGELIARRVAAAAAAAAAAGADPADVTRQRQPGHELIVVKSGAGTGKSSTAKMVALASLTRANVLPLYLAFNKATAIAMIDWNSEIGASALEPRTIDSFARLFLSPSQLSAADHGDSKRYDPDWLARIERWLTRDAGPTVKQAWQSTIQELTPIARETAGGVTIYERVPHKRGEVYCQPLHAVLFAIEAFCKSDAPPDQFDVKAVKCKKFRFLGMKCLVCAPNAVHIATCATAVWAQLLDNRCFGLPGPLHFAGIAKQAQLRVCFADDRTSCATHALERAKVRKGCPILVDESQDLNACNAAFIRAVAGRTSSQLYMFGDVLQAIYGFRGASAAIFAKTATVANVCRELTGSFRFGQAIADVANHVALAKTHCERGGASDSSWRGRGAAAPDLVLRGVASGPSIVMDRDDFERAPTERYTVVARSNMGVVMFVIDAVSSGRIASATAVSIKAGPGALSNVKTVLLFAQGLRGAGVAELASVFGTWERLVEESCEWVQQRSKDAMFEEEDDDTGEVVSATLSCLAKAGLRSPREHDEAREALLIRYSFAVAKLSEAAEHRGGESFFALAMRILNNVRDDRQLDVHVTNTHQAKGLEFETVVVQDDFKAGMAPMSYIDGKYVWQNTPTDEINCLYVAVTRAKQRLVLPKRWRFWVELVRTHPKFAPPVAGANDAAAADAGNSAAADAGVVPANEAQRARSPRAAIEVIDVDASDGDSDVVADDRAPVQASTVRVDAAAPAPIDAATVERELKAQAASAGRDNAAAAVANGVEFWRRVDATYGCCRQACAVCAAGVLLHDELRGGADAKLAMALVLGRARMLDAQRRAAAQAGDQASVVRATRNLEALHAAHWRALNATAAPEPPPAGIPREESWPCVTFSLTPLASLR